MVTFDWLKRWLRQDLSVAITSSMANLITSLLSEYQVCTSWKYRHSWQKIAIALIDLNKGERKAHASEIACLRQLSWLYRESPQNGARHLSAKSPDDYANDDSTNRAHADDWRIGLGDDRVGDAQQ